MGCFNDHMKSSQNGFTTKADLRLLEFRINKRFGRVDKQFGQVDKRFEDIDKRFEDIDKRFEQIEAKFSWFREEIRLDLDQFKKDAFAEFDSKWLEVIDPVLAEIKNHREKEAFWFEHERRREEAWLEDLRQVRQEMKQREERWINDLGQTRALVAQIAQKMGV